MISLPHDVKKCLTFTEIADYINIPIMQELLYILNTEMKAEIKDQTFRVSFDFKLLKTNE